MQSQQNNGSAHAESIIEPKITEAFNKEYNGSFNPPFIPADNSNTDYYAKKGYISSTYLRTLLDNPTKAREMWEGKYVFEPTEATNIGSAVHDYFFDNYKYVKTYFEKKPERNSTAKGISLTKEEVQENKAFNKEKEDNGAVLFNDTNWATVQRLIATLSDSRELCAIHSSTRVKFEQEFYAEIEGLKYKIRCDAIQYNKEGKIEKVYDLKTCKNSDPSDFIKKCIYDTKYDIQACLYVKVLKHLGLASDDIEFIFVPIDKSEFPQYSFVHVTQEVLDNADKKIQDLIKIHLTRILVSDQKIKANRGHQIWKPSYTPSKPKKKDYSNQPNIMSSISEKEIFQAFGIEVPKKETIANDSVVENKPSIQTEEGLTTDLVTSKAKTSSVSTCFQTTPNISNLSLYSKLSSLKAGVSLDYKGVVTALQLDAILYEYGLHIEHTYIDGVLTSNVLCLETGQFKQATTDKVGKTISAQQKVENRHIYDLLRIELISIEEKKKPTEKETNSVGSENSVNSKNQVLATANNEKQIKSTSSNPISNNTNKQESINKGTSTSNDKEVSTSEVEEQAKEVDSQEEHNRLILKCKQLLTSKENTIGSFKVKEGIMYAESSIERAKELIEKFDQWKVKWEKEYKELNFPNKQTCIEELEERLDSYPPVSQEEVIEIVVVDPQKPYYKANIKHEDYLKYSKKWMEQFDDIVTFNDSLRRIEVINYDRFYGNDILNLLRSLKKTPNRYTWQSTIEQVRENIGGVQAFEKNIIDIQNRHITKQISEVLKKLGITKHNLKNS